jgi:uncharacterized protein DUF4231
MTETSALPPFTEKRRQRADEYFQTHLKGQREWYSNKASSNKKWGQWLSVLVITAGALISVIQLLPEDSGARWATIVTAILGLVVVVAKGIDRIGQFEETWVSYRKASESMKREYRLYINNAGPYVSFSDEEACYRHFVEQVEQIIAEEQQIFWQSQNLANGNQDTPAKPKSDSD